MEDNLYPEFDKVSLEDLHRLVTMVSLESAGADQFFSDVKSRFTQFFGKADTFFKHLKFEVIGVGKVDGSSLVRGVTKVGYMNASSANVVVPSGFIGLWMPYADDLYTGMKMAGQLPTITSSFVTCLSKLVSDPELLRSANGIPYSAKYDVGLYAHVQGLNKKYFETNNESITRPLSGVIERVGDVSVTMNSINDAVTFDRQNPSQRVLNDIGRAMALSKTLMPILEEGDGMVSKPVREQLIALTYSIAREVEAYSVMLYRLRQFKLSVEDSLRTVKL